MGGHQSRESRFRLRRDKGVSKSLDVYLLTQELESLGALYILTHADSSDS